MAREINLVPDIKNEMIKTLKLRNFVFFLCIVIAAASVGVVAILGTIMGGQQLAIDGKKSTIDNLSSKLTSFSDLSDYLTIQNQLSDLSSLADNKKVLSRAFDALSAILPHGLDTITISELTVDLTADQPSFTIDAQANAGTDPYIDYNVLDSFKKSMQYMRYDYGHYVDKEGYDIPAYCIIESGANGATLKDSDRGIFALWAFYGEGCNPGEAEASDYTFEKLSDYGLSPTNYNLDEREDGEVIRIWRTPQFSDWYSENPSSDEPNIDLNGNISNVAHFESICLSYSGDDSEDSEHPKWTESNNCALIPDGVDGITIVESSNGRNSEDDLVLRFSAIISFAPEFFQFNNYHMLAISPSARYNVTDSFVQIQAMFEKRAADCAKDDTTCNSAVNSGRNLNTNGGE